MKTKWNELSSADKAMLIVRIVVSVAVIILASLQLLGIWDKAINLTAPMIAVVLILQSVQEWKTNRPAAIFGLFATLFIFACAVIVWFVP